MDSVSFFPSVSSEFACAKHGASAVCFQALSGSQVFYCSNCVPRDLAVLADCHAVSKMPLLKALQGNAGEMRKRKEKYCQASEFLSAMSARHTEVFERGKSLIERMYTLYMAVSNLHHQTFEALLDDLKQEVETVYDRPSYRLTKLCESLLQQNPECAKNWADTFFQVPHSAEIEALQRKCEEPMWKSRQVVKKELAQAMLDKFKGVAKPRTAGVSDSTLADSVELGLRLPSQDDYTGELNHSEQRHGTGKCCYRNGDVYEGEWKFDFKQGVGTHKFKNGDRYTGMWDKGEMHGLGVLKWRGGITYEGKFDRGKPKSPYSLWKYSYKGAPIALVTLVCLLSVLALSNAYHLFLTDFVAHRMEFERYGDGFYYGQFHDGERHGMGTFLWPSGDVYVGMWDRNRKHGEGVLFEAGMDLHTGRFENDIFYQGRSLLHEGEDVYFGESLLGQKHGTGVYVSANGTIFYGTWARQLETGIGASVATDFLYFGNFTGNGTTLKLHDDGTVYIGQTYAGLRHGKGVCLRPDGSFRTGAWENGKQSGWGFQYETGIYLVGSFANDTFNSGYGSMQYQNGEEYFGAFLQGKPSGNGTYLYQNGAVHTGTWESGEISGPGVRFEGSGFLKGNFSNSSLTSGSGLLFLPNHELYFGGLQHDKYFGNGTLVSANATYSGEWFKNQPHGLGFKGSSDGNFSLGRFISGQFVEGTELSSYDGGMRYFGQMKSQRHHGQGTLLFSNLTVYSGQWDSGKMHGLGIYAKAGELIFNGSFANDVFDRGTGLYKFASGDVYYGEYHKKAMNGSGIYMWANASAYAGTWNNGKRTGTGLHVDPKTGFYSGVFTNGRHVRGRALIVYESGDVYYGQIDGGLAGAGAYIWNSGSAYLGNWQAGLMSGQGLYIQQQATYMRGTFRNNSFDSGSMLKTLNGTTYIGETMNGLFHGNGTYLYPQGSVYTGKWVAGKQQGYGFFALPNLDFSLGVFNNTTLASGRSLMTYESGDRYYGNIEAGKRTGCGAYIWENGTVYSGSWVDDHQAGRGFTVRFDEDRCVGELQERMLPDGAAVMSVCVFYSLLIAVLA